jgi:hypothetical protein
MQTAMEPLAVFTGSEGVMSIELAGEQLGSSRLESILKFSGTIILHVHLFFTLFLSLLFHVLHSVYIRIESEIPPFTIYISRYSI